VSVARRSNDGSRAISASSANAALHRAITAQTMGNRCASDGPSLRRRCANPAETAQIALIAVDYQGVRNSVSGFCPCLHGVNSVDRFLSLASACGGHWAGLRKP
jgi:hypothetical protein